jgi:hypothetical protein
MFGYARYLSSLAHLLDRRINFVFLLSGSAVFRKLSDDCIVQGKYAKYLDAEEENNVINI